MFRIQDKPEVCKVTRKAAQRIAELESVPGDRPHQERREERLLQKFREDDIPF